MQFVNLIHDFCCRAGEAWPIFRLSYMYFGLLGTLLVLLIGTVATLFVGGQHAKPEYLHPLARRLLPRDPDVALQPELLPLNQDVVKNGDVLGRTEIVN
jgi:hypothetical protein